MPGGAQPTPGRLPLLEAFPTGIPPASLTKQLQAIELDEIPDHFKLSRTGGNRRMLLWGGLVFAVLVTAGILVGVLGVRDQGAITIPSAIEIVSSPEGATVSVDGTTLPAKTPTRFENAEAAGRYLIVIELRRYQRWEREVSIPKDGGVIKLIARLELVLVTLKVKSDPPGAEVFVNRKSMGRTPVELAELDPALTKTIELRKKGYRPIRVTLEWKDDETDKTLSYELKK